MSTKSKPKKGSKPKTRAKKTSGKRGTLEQLEFPNPNTLTNPYEPDEKTGQAWERGKSVPCAPNK